MFTKTLLSATLTAIVFGATMIAAPVTADAHGPGGPSSHSAPASNFGNKPIKVNANSATHQMQHRRKKSGAEDIDPAEENDDVCKWTKKNGHDVKTCSNDDE